MDYLKVLKAFLEHRIQFVVAGGFASIAHGVVRVTMDLDLIVVMTAQELSKAWDTLTTLGFKCRQPVTKKQAIDPKMLETLGQEKHMKALSFYHEVDNFVVVDLLIGNEFKCEPTDIIQLNLFGMTVPVLSREKLVALKEKAGRPKDLEDIHVLKKRQK